MAKLKTPTKCHPGRQNKGHGMCQSCYTKWLRDRDRKAFNKKEREYYAKNPEQMRETRRRWASKHGKSYRMVKNHGVTLADYNRVGAIQEGRCGICKNPMKLPHIDHCHSTGQVRGLLCFKCNYGLGHFKDDPEALRTAATYIEHWERVHNS